jgi:hypothetical protein
LTFGVPFFCETDAGLVEQSLAGFTASHAMFCFDLFFDVGGAYNGIYLHSFPPRPAKTELPGIDSAVYALRQYN